jgi:hypothetical protein
MSLNILLSVILVLPHFAVTPQRILADLLPGNGEVQGWTKHRSMQHFVGEDLYEYIDGGAEIYHEYGFIQVAIQDYLSGEEKSVSVEIFEMASPGSAYGMYTFKTGTKGKIIRVGNDAQLDDYYMNFWKGSFLVTLTGFDETEETRQGLLAIAANVDSKMPAGGEKPRILSFLPEEDLKTRSLEYFTGYLGLRSSHPFFSLRITGFEEGIKGDYSGNFSLFLFRYSDTEECQKGFENTKGQEDSRGRRFFAFPYREFLMLLMGDVNPALAERVFGKTRKKIQE